MTASPPRLRLARQIAFAVPALLLGGAYIGQYAFGLYPCEMCWWQRYPHFSAIAFAFLSTVAPPKRVWIVLAGIAILVSGAIGAFHAGVEYGWWQGITDCATPASAGTSALDAIMNAPMVRCDAAPWSLLGVSLAGFNFLISTAGGLAVLWLALTAKERRL